MHILPLQMPSLTIFPLLLSACMVQEEHYFMDTVELRGLTYDPVLQDENSGFSIVLSSVLKSKVSPHCNPVERPIFP